MISHYAYGDEAIICWKMALKNPEPHIVVTILIGSSTIGVCGTLNNGHEPAKDPFR